MPKKYSTFLSAKYSEDYVAKFDMPCTNELIAAKTNCTAATVMNWADPSHSSIMKVTQAKHLADLMEVSFDEFFKNYIK